jgi:tRNA(fMet)-specific endonuclease VapC
MQYMLDTNICIYIIKKHPIHVLNNLKKRNISDICLSSITLAELEYGVQKSERKNQNSIALAEFLAPLEIMPFDEAAAIEFGKIRALLEKNGTLIGEYDLMIAAHALALDLILVTNNANEFKRVPALRIDNWV